MYLAYYGANQILHNVHLESTGAVLIDATLSLELNTSGTFTFTLTSEHPLYSEVRECDEKIYLYDDDELIFCGYVVNVNVDFDNNKICTCNGCLSLLADSIVQAYSYTSNCTPATMLTRLLTIYNSQVGAIEPTKAINLANSVINIPNNVQYASFENSDWQSCWECISSQIIEQCGGYIFWDVINPRTDAEYNRIRYVSNLTDESPQTIEFGQNLLSIQNAIDTTEVISCLYPIGANGLTIESVNSTAYIKNESSISNYGAKWGAKTWDSITNASQLLEVARTWLANNSGIRTIELSALDLSYINDIRNYRWKLGQKIRVISLPHAIDSSFLLVRLEIDINNLANNSITLGQIRDTLTGRLIKNSL